MSNLFHYTVMQSKLKGEHIMGIVISLLYRNKVKVTCIGKTIDILILIASMSSALVDKVSKEKGVDIEKAKKIIIECIESGIRTL